MKEAVTKFSDPEWWQTAPLKPPKAVSAPMLVLGTFLPLLVIGGVVALVVTHRSHKPQPAFRSLAAFDACMVNQGANTPSVSANSRLLRLVAESCKGHLPKGTPLPVFAPPEGAAPTGREAFQQCVQSALAGSRGGGGRLARLSRQALQNAVALCRTFAAPGGSGTGHIT